MSIGPKTELTYQKLTEAKDVLSSRTETWTKKRKITGVLRELKGDERLANDKVTLIRTHRFYIDPPLEMTVSVKEKFTLGTRTFRITYIHDPLEQGRRYEIDLLEET